MKPEKIGKKKKKSYPVGREVVKLFQFIVNMMLYIENLKKNTYKHKRAKKIKLKAQSQTKLTIVKANKHSQQRQRI